MEAIIGKFHGAMMMKRADPKIADRIMGKGQGRTKGRYRFRVSKQKSNDFFNRQI